MSPGSGSPGWRPRPPSWSKPPGAVVLELAGSPFHTDAGLHPVRTLLERRCGIGRLTDQAERLRLLEAEVAVLFVGSGDRGAVVGAGAGHRRRGRL